jgi:hypothetical protein
MVWLRRRRFGGRCPSRTRGRAGDPPPAAEEPSSSRRSSACSAPRVAAHGSITADFAPPPDVGGADLRGQTGDEALLAVERYLDDAFRASIAERIIHGKGTGTYAARRPRLLAKHPFVSSYEEAQREYGGEGVTIVACVVTSRV